MKLRRLPGVEGVWVFIAADMCIFGVLFASFMQERYKDPALFEASRQTLNLDFGGVNTLILLTSSWFVALAVDAIKGGEYRRVAPYLAGSVVCGLGFMVSKAIEYTGKLAAGLTPGTNQFFMYYFSLTGLHLFHVIVGTTLLGVLWMKARPFVYDGGNRVFVESVASYWHMVDLLWIILFPLFYLMR